MMNNENQISTETKLFGYIGEEAGASRFSAIINKMLKESGTNAMVIPMNIREDDLYFTLANMKKSHVNGAVISSEYVDRVVELLDEATSLVKRSGMCDIVFREEQRLRGDLIAPRVLSEYLKDLYASKIAIIGINHYAKAFSFLSCGFNVSYFHENLEELMAFTQELELGDADINRISKDMSMDFSTFDAVLDFSEIMNLSMVDSLAKVNLDMKNKKQFSSLKQRTTELGAKYVSYDDLLEQLTRRAYSEITK
jgi:hypothetical protein